jgi:hypothetical protein
MVEKKYQTFKDFYPFYLKEHSNKTCRRLHVVGSTIVLVVMFYALISQQYKWLFSLPFIGYGFAWVGHYFFEKNVPATFTYPLYSFMGDWVLWWHTITFQSKKG